MIAIRALGTWVLCLAAYYFYDKGTAGGAETRELGIIPYIVITIWFGWIFVHNRILLRKLAFEGIVVWYLIFLIAGVAAVSFIQQQIVLAVRGTANKLLSIAPSVLFYTVLGSLVFLAFEYLRRRKDLYHLETLKKEMELQQLKSQLNPHFLFNALNNIYSYNLENDKRGNDLILKLSQLMRFIVEATQRENIRLDEEISFIESYIEFERERLGERCTITYENRMSLTEKTIPPLLLFPFIENAFKHGTNSIQPTSITIRINNINNKLTLMVTNQLTPVAAPSTKTGLNNVARRLELLFPSHHRLNIQPGPSEYTVDLELHL